jgi:hypothetical protein
MRSISEDCHRSERFHFGRVKTAATPGLAIPRELLVFADEVIE